MVVDSPVGINGRVFVLDHQPFIPFFAVFEFDEGEAAVEFFAVEGELDFTAHDLFGGVEIAFGLEDAAIPNHDRASAVAAFGNVAFKIGVVEGMIFGLDGETLIVGIQRRAFGDSPGLQGAVHGKTKIVVEAACGMLLDDKRWLGCGGRIGTGRFGGAIELALFMILGELIRFRHGGILTQGCRRALYVVFSGFRAYFGLRGGQALANLERLVRLASRKESYIWQRPSGKAI